MEAADLMSAVLIVDGRLRAHLAHAVSEHLTWCRRNHVNPPPELAALLAALTDHGGRERPEVESVRAEREPVSVDYEAAAGMLGVSARTVRRMTGDGRLPAVRAGRRVLIPLAAVRGFAEARP
jgi:excisionase family DNA binding protein